MLLSGCAQNPPGVAAEVGDSRITDQQVDDFAEVLCALNTDPAAAGTPTATRTVRFQSLQLLVGNELALDLVDPETLDQRQVRRLVARSAATRESVPEDLRPVFDDALRDFVTGQLGLTRLGRQSLREQGEPAGQQAAQAEGERLRSEHATEVGLSVDPRYGRVEDGVLTPANGSLSVAVSETALQAEADNADASALPVSQTCG
jgi:hypothetical protein